jgi:hypothetical protein
MVDLWRWDKVWWRWCGLLVDALRSETLGATSNGAVTMRSSPRVSSIISCKVGCRALLFIRGSPCGLLGFDLEYHDNFRFGNKIPIFALCCHREKGKGNSKLARCSAWVMWTQVQHSVDTGVGMTVGSRWCTASDGAGSGTVVCTTGASGDLAGGQVVGCCAREWAKGNGPHNKKRKEWKKVMGWLGKKIGKRRNGAGPVLRIQPKRLLRIGIPFYFLGLFQNQIKFKQFLNEFST